MTCGCEVRPVESARTAAEAVRALNHATVGDGFAWPSELDEVIGELLLLAQRLPQALAQLGGWLAAAHRAGRVGHDVRPDDVDEAVAGLLAGLDVARRHAEALAGELSVARTLSGHLVGTETKGGPR